MENASKALIIAGAILLSILIIAIGMYIYTSSHNSISEAGSQINEQEKTSFNQQWNTYEGKQGGNNVKAMLQKLIANCNTNAEEDFRLVNVQLGDPDADVYKGIGSDATNKLTETRYIPITVGGTYQATTAPTTYESLAQSKGTLNGTNKNLGSYYSPEGAVKALQVARTAIEARHTYTITIEYSPETSLVNLIKIAY